MQPLAKFGQKVIQFAINLMVSVAAAALAAMMFLMAADVVGRYFFNSPIPGGLELVEFLMAITIPLSIAYCALQRSHVAVDLVVDHFPAPVRKVLAVIVTSLSIVFLGVISWQNFIYIVETYHSNITSAVLKVPSYPFVAAVAIGMSVFCLILVIQLFSGTSKE